MRTSARSHVAMAGLVLALSGAGCTTMSEQDQRAAASPASLVEVDRGVYLLRSGSADALLSLGQRADVKVLRLGALDREHFSESHIARLRDWVNAGGTLWVEGRAADEQLLQPLLQVNVERFDFEKTATGDRGGELIVRNASPRIRIADDPLMTGVDQLYLYPRFRFDGTPNARPLVTMTDSGGNSGIVLAAVSLGQGTVVLDGTARESRFLFGRIPGFDPDHPNAVRKGDTWEAYDWPQLVRNAAGLPATGEGTGTGSTQPEAP